jgi:hypothetical protein
MTIDCWGAKPGGSSRHSTRLGWPESGAQLPGGPETRVALTTVPGGWNSTATPMSLAEMFVFVNVTRTTFPLTRDMLPDTGVAAAVSTASRVTITVSVSASPAPGKRIARL